MSLAESHNWLPEQVDALDPVFVSELMLQKSARADHQLFSQDAKDNKELRRTQNRRKVQLARWREECS